MTPVWSPEAVDDLAALRAYIEQDDPAAAKRVALHIIRNVEPLLPGSPEMARPGRVPGTRELVIPKTLGLYDPSLWQTNYLVEGVIGSTT